MSIQGMLLPTSYPNCPGVYCLSPHIKHMDSGGLKVVHWVGRTKDFTKDLGSQYAYPAWKKRGRISMEEAQG